MTSTRSPRPKDDPIARAITYALVSPNELDANMESANVVDAIVKAGRIQAQQTARVADALNRLAEAVEKLAAKE